MASQQLKRKEKRQASLKNGGMFLSQIYQLSLGSPKFCKIFGTLLFILLQPRLEGPSFSTPASRSPFLFHSVSHHQCPGMEEIEHARYRVSQKPMWAMVA